MATQLYWYNEFKRLEKSYKCVKCRKICSLDVDKKILLAHALFDHKIVNVCTREMDYFKRLDKRRVQCMGCLLILYRPTRKTFDYTLKMHLLNIHRITNMDIRWVREKYYIESMSNSYICFCCLTTFKTYTEFKEHLVEKLREKPELLEKKLTREEERAWLLEQYAVKERCIIRCYKCGKEYTEIYYNNYNIILMHLAECSIPECTIKSFEEEEEKTEKPQRKKSLPDDAASDLDPKEFYETYGIYSDQTKF